MANTAARLPRSAGRVAVLGALFGAWELFTGGFGGALRPAVNQALLPPPSAALSDLVVYAQSGLLATDLAATLGAAGAGLVLGMCGGVVLGLILGWWRSVADLVKAVRVMGATRLDIVRIVVVPAVLQWVFAALRTSVSFALTGAVVAEFVGSTAGLGYRMAIASGLLNSPRLFAILLILALVGTVLVELAKRIEQSLLRWRPAAELA